MTRSGSNELHGSAYEFHRNREFDAANFFSNKSGASKPFRLRNQFGGALGGRIVRNRAFFFGDYEGLRDRARLERQEGVAVSLRDSRIIRGRLEKWTADAVDVTSVKGVEHFARANVAAVRIEKRGSRKEGALWGA